MKKLFYTFMSVIALCEFVPTSAFAQNQYDLETAQPDTTKQNYHLIDGVEISTVRKLVSNNAVSSQLNNKTIERSLGQSLGTMLERVSGVSSIQTGGTVSKPVIHGMYGNRILLVNNGARLTGQQWGADHAPEVDKNSSTKIEVVKGAEAVRYGSDALGGIVVMEQDMLPYNQKHTHGRLLSMYGSNGYRYQFVGNAEGSMAFLPSLAWRIQATYANSGDQRAAHYLLNNTGTREFDFSTALGYQHKNFRAEGYLSRYDLKLGVLYNAQMGDADLLAERIKIGRPVDITPYTRHIDYPFQHIVHTNATLKLYYNTEKYGDFYWLASFQKDDREENRIRRMNLSYIPAVSMHLKTLQNYLRWRKYYGDWQTEVGTQVVNSNHSNQRGTGVVPIIPNHTENQIGAYALQKYQNNRLGAELGVRFDWQDTKAAGYDWTGDYYGGHRTFSNFTYSLGAHYHATDRLTLTTNFGLAWRAPHVFELYSNGNELGTGRFVRGDSTMCSENSYKWVVSTEYRSTVLDARLDAYLQWVKHYIYDRPMKGEYVTVISGTYPLFQYMQTDVFIRGIDFDLRLRPLSAIEYHIVSSMIWANETRTHNYLPYIPSFRINHSLTYTPHLSGKAFAPWIEVKHRFVARQTRFNAASDLIAYAPASYSLFGLEAGTEWRIDAHNTLSLFVSADNIFNKEYKEYTNRARYYAHDLGRDIRLTIGWKF